MNKYNLFQEKRFVKCPNSPFLSKLKSTKKENENEEDSCSFTVLLIGIYQVMQVLHLTDSILGLIFINAAFNQAFTIWLLRGTFIGISAEMEQAATIDGCNRIQSMMRVLSLIHI